MDNISSSALEEEDSTEPKQAEGVSFTQLKDYQTIEMLWKVWPPHILLLGAFGNIATIAVMRRLKDHNSSQHVLLMSLAVSDFSLLYTGALREWLRHTVHVDVQSLNNVSCKIHSWLLYSFNVASAWLVTSVTVQRTIAVIWPHKVRALCTVRITWAIVAALVFTAGALNFHFVVGIVLSEDKTHCTLGSVGYAQFYKRIFTWIDMCVSSLVPAVTQLVCDVILSSTLLQATSISSMSVQGTSTTNTSHGSDSRRKTASRTTVMVLTLSCMFLVLTMPTCICLLWYNHVETPTVQAPEFTARKSLVYGVTFLLWYTNSSINFILYCVTGTKFRKEFLSWVCCGTHGHPTTPGGETIRGSFTKGKQKQAV